MEYAPVKTRSVTSLCPGALTDGGLAELAGGHLVGNVSSHQHTDVNAHLLSDDVRNELQPLRTLVYALQGRQWVRGRETPKAKRLDTVALQVL